MWMFSESGPRRLIVQAGHRVALSARVFNRLEELRDGWNQQCSIVSLRLVQRENGVTVLTEGSIPVNAGITLHLLANSVKSGA